MIKNLKPKQGKVELTADVVSKDNPKEVKNGELKICNFKIKDETGEIDLVLWNEDIDKVNIGDKVKIVNGYVNEWQGVKQLTPGRFGSLEVV